MTNFNTAVSQGTGRLAWWLPDNGALRTPTLIPSVCNPTQTSFPLLQTITTVTSKVTTTDHHNKYDDEKFWKYWEKPKCDRDTQSEQMCWERALHRIATGPPSVKSRVPAKHSEVKCNETGVPVLTGEKQISSAMVINRTKMPTPATQIQYSSGIIIYSKWTRQINYFPIYMSFI